MTAYLAGRLNARRVSTSSLTRAATARLTHVVQGHRKADCATLGRQLSMPFNDALVAPG
jgi:hypothetical protein